MSHWNINFLFVILTTLPFSIFSQKELDVQSIVNRSIQVHGGDKVQKGEYSFDFRKYHYTYRNNDGSYTYTRQNKETGIKDILNNEGIKRYDKTEPISFSPKQAKSYSNSTNSVIYFAFLPYFLNDAAVRKELIGEVKIQEKDYYKIRVTFAQQGGGDDFEDVYVYWIDKESFSMDYLAYSFHVNGGGIRFREAYNVRIIDGVRFQDYVNYKHDKSTPVEELDRLFGEGELTELSRIELKNIKSGI